jgi:hypothetical protein
LPAIGGSIFLSLGLIFHGSSFASNYWIYFLLGLSVVIDFIFGMLNESYFLMNVSGRTNTLANMISLIIFEFVFFVGTYWMYVESRLQNLNLIRVLTASEAGIVLEMNSNFYLSGIDQGLLFCDVVGNISGGLELNYFGVYLNLCILLLVSLLLQFLHRKVILYSVVLFSF